MLASQDPSLGITFWCEASVHRGRHHRSRTQTVARLHQTFSGQGRSVLYGVLFKSTQRSDRSYWQELLGFFQAIVSVLVLWAFLDMEPIMFCL